MGWLEHVRTQPKAARSRHAFFAATVATVVIGGIWMATLPTRFAEPAESIDVSENESDSLNVLQGIFGNVKQSFSEVGETLSADEQTGDVVENRSSTTIDIEALLNAPPAVDNSAPAPIVVPIRIATTAATTT